MSGIDPQSNSHAIAKYCDLRKHSLDRCNEEMWGKVKFPSIEIIGSLFFQWENKETWMGDIEIAKSMIEKNDFSFCFIIGKIKHKFSNQSIKVYKK